MILVIDILVISMVLIGYVPRSLTFSDLSYILVSSTSSLFSIIRTIEAFWIYHNLARLCARIVICFDQTTIGP
jgi:hypothetical protein